MSELPPELLQKIGDARTVNAIASSDLLTPFRQIRSLLFAQADRHEEKPFLIFFDGENRRREYSYRDFTDDVCRTANFLHARGIRKGDRIATVAFNHSDTVIQYFAAFIIGAVVVPINVGEDDKRVHYLLSDSRVRLAFVREQFQERIRSLTADLPLLKHLIVVPSDTRVGHHADLRHLSSGLDPAIEEPVDSDEALIVYTSGTTGNPKAVVLTHYNLLADAMAISDWHGLTTESRMMCVLPIHHVNGTVVTLVTPLFAGCSVVLNQKFQTERFFSRIAAEQIDVVSVVPTLLQFLHHAHIKTEELELWRFRHIICGAGPLTVDLATRFEQLYQIPIIHGYGLSETTCYSCFLPVDLTREKHRHWLSAYGFPSIGVPLPINQMAIHDDEGRELEAGERGEIVVRGHNVMKYYYNNRDANEQAFSHGWFRTGDEGFFQYDEQERMFFFITGRLKELIIRGGVNISPFEIDEVLMNIPGVEAGIAVGFENDWYGEEVGAYVKLRPDTELTGDRILAICRKQLPYARSPKVVLFGGDVPVTSTGKYQRNKCKPLFAEWKSAQFRENG